MAESAIVQSLLGPGGLFSDHEEPDHAVTCAWCGKMTLCPGFVWAAVRTWNKQEGELATEAGRRPAFIHGKDMGVTCEGECTRELFKQRHEEYQADIWTTSVYLRQLRQGVYNPVSLQWLRTHGHAADVTKILNEEGNRSHG